MSRNLLKSLGAIPRGSRPRRIPIQRPLQASLKTTRLAASFHTTAQRRSNGPPPKEAPKTNFEEMNISGGAPVPATAVGSCLPTGFYLEGGARVSDGSGVLLVGGEAFGWRPWEGSGKMQLVNEKGQFEVPDEALGVFDLVWPRPDILIIGVGPRIIPLSPKTRRRIGSMGMRLEVLDTGNAAAQFNLLATERGINDIAAALIPVGWKEGEGAVE